MNHRRARRAFVCGLVLVISACGDGGGGGPSNSLLVTPAQLNLADCGLDTLTATLLDGQGNPIPGAQFSFTSTSSTIAGVTASGIVTANAVGSASIVVSSGQIKDTVPVTVTLGPLAITVSPDSINLDPNGIRAVLPNVTNCHGATVINPTVSYSSLNPAIASASAGQVIAEAPGLTGIAVSTGLVSDTVVVNVYSPSHPGALQSTFNLGGTPFGVAMSGAGQVYITKLLSAVISRDTLPFSQPIIRAFAVGSTPTDVAFVPRQMKAFVTNQGDENLGLIDVNTHAQTGVITLDDNPLRVLNGTNNRTYITLALGQVMVLNSTTNAKVDSIAVDPVPNGLALRADGGTLYVSSTATGRILVLSTATSSVVDSISVGGTPQDLALSPDELTLYVANEGLGVQQVDLGTGTVTNTLVVPAFGLQLTPDGTQLYVAGGTTVTVIDRAGFTAAPGIDVGGNARRIAFARGGRLAVISNEGGYITVLE